MVKLLLNLVIQSKHFLNQFDKKKLGIILFDEDG
jgi:hypothetical protein